MGRAIVDAILLSAGRSSHRHSKFPRRGAGVAEQGCLLSSYPDKIGIGGSNPPLSARHCSARILALPSDSPGLSQFIGFCESIPLSAQYELGDPKWGGSEWARKQGR